MKNLDGHKTQEILKKYKTFAVMNPQEILKKKKIN